MGVEAVMDTVSLRDPTVGADHHPTSSSNNHNSHRSVGVLKVNYFLPQNISWGELLGRKVLRLTIFKSDLVAIFKLIKTSLQVETAKLPFVDHGRELKWRKTCFVRSLRPGPIIRTRAAQVAVTNRMEDTNKLVMDSSRCTSNRTDFKIKGGFNSKHNHHHKRTMRLPALHQYRS